MNPLLVLAVTIYILILNAVAGSSASSLPEILKVEHKCGATLSDLGTVTVIADEPVSVTAECRGGQNEKFANTDGVHHVLEAAYDPIVTNKCVYQRKPSTGVYTLVVHVARVTPAGSAYELSPDSYTVVCTYDKTGVKASDSDTVDTSKLPFTEISYNNGGEMVSPIELQIVDVLHDPLPSSTSIELGRFIALKGSLTPAMAETGMKASSCLATNLAHQYFVLVAGCGDGTIFPQDKGFTTTGSAVVSPFFAAFRLQGNDTMKFICNFTSCTGADGCDGDSCLTTSKRRKRDTSLYDDDMKRDTSPYSNDVIGLSPSIEVTDSSQSDVNDVQEKKSFDKIKRRFRRWALRTDRHTENDVPAIQKHEVDAVPKKLTL